MPLPCNGVGVNESGWEQSSYKRSNLVHGSVYGGFLYLRGKFKHFGLFSLRKRLKVTVIMSNSPRIDGRLPDQPRKFKITPGFLAHPIASALVECGGTKVVCSASFEQGVPSWMRQQGVSGGWVTCEYGMIPGAGNTRVAREASRGKQSGRTMEIQRLIGRSFRSVIDMEALGQNTLYIDCDVIDADGGTRCASICGTSVVLQIAFRKLLKMKKIPRFPMRENVGAISVGIRNGKILLDLCYEEDSAADVDMNVIMTESGKFVEIQGTAEEEPFDRAQLDQLLEYAKIGLAPIFAAQKRILEDYPLPPSNEAPGSLASAFANIKL